jgi:hypothetical protein
MSPEAQTDPRASTVLDEMLASGFALDQVEDYLSGAPRPPYVRTPEECFRWDAARELARGVAEAACADPAEVSRYVTSTVRSLYWNEELPTFGPDRTIEAYLRIKRAIDERAARRRTCRRRWRTILRVWSHSCTEQSSFRAVPWP